MKKFWNKESKKIALSIILFGLGIIITKKPYQWILLGLSYGIISANVYVTAFENLKKKEIFDENFLMIIATIGAILIKSYEEAVMVILLFEIGEYLSDLAIENSRQSIIKLMDLRSDKIHLKTKEGIKDIDCKKVSRKDIFIVKPGEKVPIDGKIIEGESFFDTSSLTGEPIPKRMKEQDLVLSGYINKENPITVVATSTYETSTATKIIKMIEEANDKKTDTEKWITKFAKIYTPIVVLLAILLTIIPILLGGEISIWLKKSLVFLVTSCPCALVISVPLSYFCGIGAASKEGILLKGSMILDKLTKLKTIALDKTGTVTEGIFEVRKIVAVNLTEEKLLEIAAYAESYSNHPIAKSILNKYGKKIKEGKISNYQEISGKGISCTNEQKKILLGNQKLMEENKIEVPKVQTIGTIIYLCINKKYQGYLEISDKIKESATQLVEKGKNQNYHFVILSGDTEEMVKKVADEVKIKNYYSSLLPIDKVEKIKELKKQGMLLFVGDGINDALAMKTADISVAMGKIGSDAAVEASDIVIMQDNLSKISQAITIAKRTRQKVISNLIFAIGIKLLFLLLGILGKTTIWMAVFADVGVTLLLILNSLLLIKRKKE